MKTRNDFFELDQGITRQIMRDMEGQVVDSICPDCNGGGCFYCNYSGSVTIQY